jgi:hypothetical protein
MARNMSDDHEIRLTVLEHDMRRLTTIPDTIHAMDKKIDQVLARKDCPAPGMCLGLDERVTAIELKQAEATGTARGSWKVIGLVASCSSAVTGFFTWLSTYLHTTK